MMRGALSSLLLAGALVVVGGGACQDGTEADLGRDALLRVEGAQFIRGTLPGEAGGPPVSGIELFTNVVVPGEGSKAFAGALGRGAGAALVGLADDVGYWIIVAGPPNVQTPDLPSFETRISFSSKLGAGARDLLLRAVDEQGHPGPLFTRTLTVVPTTVLVDGGAPPLIVSLRWDTNADLDLHVVDPHGVEIWKRNPNSFEPPSPGSTPDLDGPKRGAILDVDSNAQCVVDGRNRENVVWRAEPPRGHYVVRVDTFSLCDALDARWNVEVVLQGSVIGRAAGQATDFDTRFPHDRGAGVLALEFDVQ